MPKKELISNLLKRMQIQDLQVYLWYQEMQETIMLCKSRERDLKTLCDFKGKISHNGTKKTLKK